MTTMREICELLETLPKVLRSVEKSFMGSGYVIRSKGDFLDNLAKSLFGKDAYSSNLPRNFQSSISARMTLTRSGRGWYFAGVDEAEEFIRWIIGESMFVLFKEYLDSVIRNSIVNLLLAVSTHDLPMRQITSY